jgi:glutamate-1-semialdehyde 2,1-aminomutase
MFKKHGKQKKQELEVPSLPKHVAAGHRTVPDTYVPVDEGIIEDLLAKEWETFRRNTQASESHNLRAKRVLPLGVTSSFQHWDPYPISIVSGKGSYLTDVDGRKLLDLSMGFGAMLVGHLNPKVVKAVKRALKKTGTLFVTPSTISTEAAEQFKRRFGVDMLRFTNSGTESTMYAIRAARAVTGKNGVVKVEGGYHGGYDPLQVSVKPPLDKIGDAAAPTPHVPSEIEGGKVFVVPYNDVDALREIFREHSHKISCFVVEPVIENLSIVLPDEGYLEGVRDLCDVYDVALIFDEVKTGLTAGVAGAAKRLGVEPDLICLAKSLGGGMPIAAFGGKEKYMSAVVDGRMAHFGTYNGNPISCAAVIAVDEIATEAALAKAEAINLETLRKLDEIIEKYQLPAHTVGFGVKGAVIWKPTPVRNYRDFKETNFDLAELSWLWGINRGIITPPGLDEQWLVSLMTTQTDMNKLISHFEELAIALRN